MILKPETVYRYIIRKDGKYLVGNPYESMNAIRYSINKFDGVMVQEFLAALAMARVVGGEVMKLNILTGEMTGGWK